MNRSSAAMRIQEFLKLINIQVPIVQAPMAGVSTAKLAAAVSNSGALGSVAIGGASNVESARNMIRQTKQLTSKPFNVNVFCHQDPEINVALEKQWIHRLDQYFKKYDSPAPTELHTIYSTFVNNDAMLEMILSEAPAVISFHFGLPSAGAVQRLKHRGIVTMACITSLAEAKEAELAGIDVLIVQGIEAGGHRGCFDPSNDKIHLPLIDLLDTVSINTSLPLVAAGGIMTGADIKKVIDHNACAASLGTAYILCPESSAELEHRALLKTDKAKETAITDAISGRPARGITNTLYKLGSTSTGITVPSYPRAYDIAKRLHAAAKSHGNYEFGAYWAGSKASLCCEMDAADLTNLLYQEYLEAHS
ncbi:2-nitropropane dioxygenase [Dipodascopsis uninucleata]